MLNEESSTAALIPFDRVFHLTAAELKEDYRVNLFTRIKRENSELLGMFGEPDAEEEEEAEASEDEHGAQDETESNDEDGNGSSEQKNGKKKKRKIMKKAKELEYDLDDPFIDDSEITDIYQSVFEMMRSGRPEPEEETEAADSDSDSEDGEGADSDSKDTKANKATRANKATKANKAKKAKMSPKRTRNFFVYRGTMTPEILSKEFEIDANELMEVEAAAAACKEATENASESEGEISKKKQMKLKLKLKTKRPRTKGAEEKPNAKKAKVQKAPKPPKVKIVKVNDLISQSAKKFSDIFSTDDPAANPSVPVFAVTGVDANLLELRQVLKRFRDSAVGTPFSPGKFPSALRPKLNEALWAMLRCSRPSLQSPLPARFFPALASFLPFSPAALNKLLSRKILGPLIESMERHEVPKLYATWEAALANRIKEDGSIIIVNTTAIPAEDPQTPQSAAATAVPTAAPPQPALKKKLKFNDEMRQIIFEVLRTEIDVNNLIILSNTFDATSSNPEIPKVAAQSELNLRKIVYQKLANSAVLPDDPAPLLSSTEISKEFGAQKRKHEKKIAKAASEILFGEAEIEEFLKELDIPKEAAKANSTPVHGETAATNTVPPASDPLNLFGNEPPAADNSASNTSLFMETTN